MRARTIPSIFPSSTTDSANILPREQPLGALPLVWLRSRWTLFYFRIRFFIFAYLFRARILTWFTYGTILSLKRCILFTLDASGRPHELPTRFSFELIVPTNTRPNFRPAPASRLNTRICPSCANYCAIHLATKALQDYRQWLLRSGRVPPIL